VDPATISLIENGKRRPHLETLDSLALVLGVEVGDFFPKAQAPLWPEEPERRNPPGGAGPTLLDKGLDAVRHDEEKDLRARARLYASEGTPQVAHSYEEDEFRAVLRERGYPDEDFESFIWPLIVKARRAEQLEEENARLQEEREQETAMHQELEIRPE
jgi:transcriptional regulator with XRE-family HTH domain